MKKLRKKKKDSKKAVVQKPAEEDKERDPFDFGGLPARDLKKNLGCG